MRRSWADLSPGNRYCARHGGGAACRIGRCLVDVMGLVSARASEVVCQFVSSCVNCLSMF